MIEFCPESATAHIECMRKRICLIHTDYPHWAKHSGYHQFIRYISSEQFVVEVQVVQMGDEHFPFTNAKLRSYIRDFLRRYGTKAYDLNDLIAEIIVMRKWWSRRYGLLHYLDGEHSLQLLPFVFRCLTLLRVKPAIIATFHQPPAMLEPYLNTKAVRLLDHIIVLSPEQKCYFEQFLPADKISLMLHGIDVDHYTPGLQQKEKKRFKCITVGSWLRDYETVLGVAKTLLSYRDIEFHIVSPDLSKNDLPKNVYVHSNLDDNDLVKMYQNSHVLFMPFLDATANNALLEGIACGLPVVSSDLPAVKAYVPGQEAILVKDNNHDQLASALLELHQNRNRLAEMGIHARQRSLELSWQKIVPELESIYSGLLQ